MACFYKRGKTWTFSLDIGKDEFGKRKKKAVGGFRTKKEAEEAAARMKVELAKGIYIEEKNITFEEFAEEWLKLYKPTVKTSTYLLRKNSFKRIYKIFPFIKKSSMPKIKKIHLENLLLESQKIYAHNTTSQIHSNLSLLFKKAMELEIISNNPMLYVTIPKKIKTFEQIQEEKLKYLQREELELFLNAAKENGLRNDYLIFSALAYTGMRVGELCALQWPDINFDDKTISINKTIFHATNSSLTYQLWPPKTKNSNRIIDIPDILVKLLKEHKKEQALEKMKYRNNWLDKDFIFTSFKYPGYPLNHKLIEKRMKRLLGMCKLNLKLYPHTLRHTHTSLLAEAGVGLEQIMERLGHSDGKITREIYLHITKNMKKESIKKFENLMGI